MGIHNYENDELIVVKPNYLEFKVGEHPLLPFEGHKFLRFSSKVSGSHARGVNEYIATVTRVAHANFGSRVRSWSDWDGQGGIYGWSEVNDSWRSYKQRDEPEIPTSIAQFVFGTDPISELSLELFEIKAIPGKGKGLVARFNIAKGKRILLERPILITPNFSPISIMETRIAAKLKSLSKAEQRKFLSLHNNFSGKHPFSGIIKTNALPCGPNSIVGAVYPTISLINHSCIPNAHHNWNDKEKWETIHATTVIKAGEEITIGYKQSSSSESRRASLKESFGFDCTCAVCSLPPPERELSDARRIQIEVLDDAIGRPERVASKPDLCLADCRFLLQALETEYKGCAYGLVSRLYYDAFQICITHGDQARAVKFAERGYKSRNVCEGGDSVEALKMKELMENPAEHRNFGVSKRWRTGKGMAPKGLDDSDFEKRLWRLDY